ncbi:60S ribosomal protein L24-like [Echinops telfairi]|uniref:60S ribosomal protein L24-like n=1 Tax=Echinops telfairi TaxID=9371 RepID=A0AC55DDJ3_ECHTE|nr:60S ribosomal protein L24-like [Echinops telfairi]
MGDEVSDILTQTPERQVPSHDPLFRFTIFPCPLLLQSLQVGLCSFSAYMINPGRGRRYTRTNRKVFQFLNATCKSAFLSKRNPRQINWTVLYRRKHKKGQAEEIQKKRTRRAVKFQRAIPGASLADRTAKRNQKPEVRKAQREQAIRAAKEAKKATQASKKTAMAATKAPTEAAPEQMILKPVKVSAPQVGGKRKVGS